MAPDLKSLIKKIIHKDIYCYVVLTTLSSHSVFCVKVMLGESHLPNASSTLGK